VGGIVVEHRTRIYFDIANRWTVPPCNEWNSRNNNRERVRRTVRVQSRRFYYNCVCPRKSVGVPTLQLSDFALFLPSVYTNWRGIYFAELKLWSTRGEINGWTVCFMNYAKIGLPKGTYAKHVFCDTTCVFHIY